MEKHQNKINITAIIASAISIITILTFSAKMFGAIAIAQQDQNINNEFRKEQSNINQIYSNSFTSINTKLDMIMEYFKISPK